MIEQGETAELLSRIANLDRLFCGRCDTIRGQLNRDIEKYDLVVIKPENRGALIHMIIRWNRRSLCGYHERVK